MIVYPLKSAIPYASASYALVCGKYFSVVDPSVDLCEALESTPELNGLTPKYVLLTHAHIDHFLCIDSYVEQGMEVILSFEDTDKLAYPDRNAAFLFPTAPRGYFGPFTSVAGGDVIDIGGDKLEVISLPGHTSGSVAYVGCGSAFVGDTVFAYGYGRYDLYSGNGEQLFSSIKRVLSLPPETVVYPGHGDSSTVEKIRSNFRFQ